MIECWISNPKVPGVNSGSILNTLHYVRLTEGSKFPTVKNFCIYSEYMTGPMHKYTVAIELSGYFILVSILSLKIPNKSRCV